MDSSGREEAAGGGGGGEGWCTLSLLIWTSPLIGGTHLSRPRSSQARPSDWNLQSAGPSGISLASVCPNTWSSVQTSAPRWDHQALLLPYTTPRLAGFGGCLGMPKYVVINSDVCSPAEPTRHSLIHIQHQGCWILASSSMKSLSSPSKRRYIFWLQSFTLLPFLAGCWYHDILRFSYLQIVSEIFYQSPPVRIWQQAWIPPAFLILTY